MNYLRRKLRERRLTSYIKNKSNNSVLFSLKDKKYTAYCISVYDGDSITVIFWFNKKYYKFKIRMLGYDTPEIRTKNEEEKKYALEAKKALEDKILDKLITIDCGDFDKYGRLLATVYIDGTNINEYMVNEKYGYPYTGKTKKTFEEFNKV